MAYRRRNSSRSIGIVILAILVVHILFPEQLQGISQKVFGWYYEKYSIARDAHIQSTEEEHESLVLFPVAYPPQTPYDVVLAKNTQKNVEVSFPQYVYTAKGNVIGYIQDSESYLYVITLFSSPLSKEKFSVGGFLAEGRGIGGGAILFEIPKDIEVYEGDTIRHLDSGRDAAYIFSIEEEKSRDIKYIRAIVFENPLYIDAYYVDEDSILRTEDASVNVLIEKIEAFQRESQQELLREEETEEEEIEEEETEVVEEETEEEETEAVEEIEDVMDEVLESEENLEEG